MGFYPLVNFLNWIIRWVPGADMLAKWLERKGKMPYCVGRCEESAANNPANSRQYTPEQVQECIDQCHKDPWHHPSKGLPSDGDQKKQSVIVDIGEIVDGLFDVLREHLAANWPIYLVAVIALVLIIIVVKRCKKTQATQPKEESSTNVDDAVCYEV